MAHEIQRLLPRHYAILELALAGLDVREIAESLSMTPTAIGQIISAPIAQSELARRRKDIQTINNQEHSSTVSRARAVLEEASLDAASTLKSLLLSQDDSVKRQSANDILNRTFGKDSAPIQVTVLNAEKLQLLMVALREDDELVAA